MIGSRASSRRSRGAPPGYPEAIHFRHLDVDERHVERFTRRLS
jgi:hypothetical protein